LGRVAAPPSSPSPPAGLSTLDLAAYLKHTCQRTCESLASSFVCPGLWSSTRCCMGQVRCSLLLKTAHRLLRAAASCRNLLRLCPLPRTSSQPQNSICQIRRAPGDSPQRSCAAPSHVSEGLAPLSQYLKAPGLRGRSLCQRGRGQLPRLSLQRSRCSARPVMDGQSQLWIYIPLLSSGEEDSVSPSQAACRGRQLKLSDRARGRDVDAPPHWPPKGWAAASAVIGVSPRLM
jgi:hypothetical protein